MKRSIVGRFLTAGVMLAMMIIPSTLSAQGSGRFGNGYYRQPLDGRMLLSANFAEARADHLHSGIDIKTGGVEGKPLYAAADGYVCRIGALPSGFGRVLYINHPNNTTTVYAHMQKFTPEIEAYVSSERYRLRKHRVDLNPSADMFPVKKGDLIGYSGNSGSSQGPHLHFEIRETPSQRIVNIPALGIYDLKDDIPPMLVRLHYIEVDTINGVPVDYPARPIGIKSGEKGKYELLDTAVVEVGKNGYLVLEATDRKNDTHNTMGIYAVNMSLDGEPVFAFKIDNYLFAEQRYVNSLTHYAMQKGARNEFLRLAVQGGNKLPVYSGVKNRGALYLEDDDIHNVDIAARDDNGNISTVSLKVKRRDGAKPALAASATEGIPIDNKRAFTRSEQGAYVNIPANSLYAPIFYTQQIDATPVKTPQGMAVYSPVYGIGKEEVPLHTAMTVAVDVAEVPDELTSKLCLARVSADGATYRYAGGKYEKGRVTASLRNFGRYCVVADNTAPMIRASFADGADLSGNSSLSFTITDDFSGVSWFEASIDGNWIPFEQQGSVIKHYFDPSRINYDGGSHEIRITVVDNKGNKSSLRRRFIK